MTYVFSGSLMPKRKGNRNRDASPPEDSASVSDGSDSKGHPHKQVATRRGAGKKAAAVKPKASAGPRLKKSTKPEWNRRHLQNSWSHNKLETEFALKCIERWCERRALDEINTKHSDKSKKIFSEELGQDTFSTLRAASWSIAASIYGASQLDEADKTQIAQTLRGSLYFTELWGNDEIQGSGRFLVIVTSPILFQNNSKIKGTTAQKITDFEEQFFGSSDWLSPLKLFNFLCTAGTVLHYKEENQSTVTQVGTKFKFFQGESEGQKLRKSEAELFLQLEKETFGVLGKDEEVCIPQRLLLLAMKDSTDK
ncbi:hypothetical protein DFH08DRAFT_828238 [Mycena albidolilacea]|uniref:Uncharacterized protein n=1 Tax=Mycena albidolilacea TaxID=1033008 RepID=A0AAD7E6B0_9AGAR|nr:hypothetical protein DFH08DRAFT_828238 [Mycena albidolilacea]